MLATYWRFANIWYFLVIILAASASFGIYHFLKDKNKEEIYKFLFRLTILNLVLHFLRLVFPPYVFEFKNSDDLRVMRVVGFENICAVNTLLGPFLFKSKNKYLKDYFMFIACVGGFVALLIPVNPYTTRELFSFDMMRYFVSHFILFIVPVMSVIFKLHEFNYQRFWALPVFFFGCLTLIYLNENITYDLGWVKEKRNFSFIYGPPDQLGPLKNFFLSLVPENLKNYVGQDGNIVECTPLLWMINPFIGIVMPLAFICNVILDFNHFKEDSKNLWNKAKEKFKRV